MSDNAEKENEGFATRETLYTSLCARVRVCLHAFEGWMEAERTHTAREEAESCEEKKTE